MKSVKTILLCFFFGSLLSACFEDRDDQINESGTLEINDFIWRGMNDIYLYKAEVPELADDYFPNREERYDFLSEFSTPEDLFYDALVAPEDEFSFLVDNYIELENALEGIGTTNGMEFGLVRFPDSSILVGYVRYVLPNTSAERNGIRRGQLFNTVDGEQLTLENYATLLEPPSYTIGLARMEGSEIIPTGETISLTKEQYTENPVFLTGILETAVGKTGYLLYNRFTGSFDAELNQAFRNFKNEGITHLVLDLRYNSGGSVESAVDLASMITGQFEGEVFSREQWNEQYQTLLEENNSEELLNRFDGTIRTGEMINSLGLTKIYIISSLRTASASELVINGLKPYIEVIQVGERTTGKFQASVTLYDSPDFRRRGANLGHTYAIQPLIYKSANAAGVTDYHEGLAPDIEVKEDFRNLGIIGDPDEPLLKAALDHLEGKRSPVHKNPQTPVEVIEVKETQNLLYQKMYDDLPVLLYNY